MQIKTGGFASLHKDRANCIDQNGVIGWFVRVVCAKLLRKNMYFIIENFKVRFLFRWATTNFSSLGNSFMAYIIRRKFWIFCMMQKVFIATFDFNWDLGAFISFSTITLCLKVRSCLNFLSTTKVVSDTFLLSW